MRFLRALLALFRHSKPTVPPVYVAPAVPCVHGVNTHRNSIGELDGVQALGARYLRTTVYTRETPEVNAAWAWKLPAMDARSVEPLLVCHDFDHDVASLGAWIAAHPDRVWQIGNEANAYPQYWLSDPATYANLMTQLVTAYPRTRFVGMGLAYGFGQVAFLKGYLAAGGPSLHAWCIHTYGTPIDYASAVRDTHAVLQGRMPLWITEYGVDSPDDTYVCDQITRVVQDAGSLGVARTYHYCYWDETNFSLVRGDESHRPAWDVLHRFIATLVVAYPFAGL